jgi:Flp pilus assembly protein TadB
MALRGTRLWDRPSGDENTAVNLVRISWLVTVAVFVIAAVLVFLSGYVGYFFVLLAVAAAAAVNIR